MKGFDRLTIIGLVAVLTWLLFKGLSPENQRVNDMRAAVDLYAASEGELYRDVLGARAGLLNHYDSVDGHLRRMREAIDTTMARADAEERPYVAALETGLLRQERLTERFKSGNALLQNSLAYFGTFSGRVSAGAGDSRTRRMVDRLSGAMLHLNLGASRTAIADLDQSIAGLEQLCRTQRCSEDVRGLLAHGRLLKTLLPDVADTIAQLLRSTGREPAAAMRRHLILEQQVAEAGARRFRILLYLASVLLAALLIRRGLMVRAQSSALRRQVGLEHAVSTLSTRLLAAGPARVEAVIQDGLGDLARQLGASRVHFWLGSCKRHYFWPQANGPLPFDCVASLLELSGPPNMGSRGIIHLVRDQLPKDSPQREALDRADLESCYCILSGGEDQAVNLLLFGFSGRDHWSAGQLGVLSAALDAISLALAHRDLETKTRSLEAQLGQARRMETVGAFASGIAHNFNNLLGAISGHVEMALTVPRLSRRIREHLDQMALSAERGKQLVQSLLSYGRRHEHRLSLVAIDALIEESVGLASAALGPLHPVRFLAGAHGAMVEVDPAGFQQVILNLCHNGAQAMDDGEDILIGSEARGDEVVIAVADRGSGIDPAHLRKIFDPFFTTRPAGTGLGLSTARDIVAELNGRIEVDSVPGSGTTVTITLPRARTLPGYGAAKRARPGGLLRGHGEVVAFVASDEQEQFAGEELLAALGYEPVGFSTPASALAALREAPARFDALLVASGMLLDLVAEARRLLPDAPRILATARAREHRADRLVEAGVTAVIQRPLDARELSATLHMLLSRDSEPAGADAGLV